MKGSGRTSLVDVSVNAGAEVALATVKAGLNWWKEAELPPRFRMKFNSSCTNETKFIARLLCRSKILNHSSATEPPPGRPQHPALSSAGAQPAAATSAGMLGPGTGPRVPHSKAAVVPPHSHPGLCRREGVFVPLSFSPLLQELVLSWVIKV